MRSNIQKDVNYYLFRIVAVLATLVLITSVFAARVIGIC